MKAFSVENQAALTAYAWPRLPARFVDRYVPTRVADNEAHRRRKARTDVRVPITQIITALVMRRQAAVQRLVEHFRAAVADVEADRQQLPVTIEYADAIPDVNRDAVRMDDVRWVNRPVQLRFTLSTPRAARPPMFPKTNKAQLHITKHRDPDATAGYRLGRPGAG